MASYAPAAGTSPVLTFSRASRERFDRPGPEEDPSLVLEQDEVSHELRLRGIKARRRIGQRRRCRVGGVVEDEFLFLVRPAHGAYLK